MKFDNLSAEKLFHDFTFHLQENGVKLEGSDKVGLKRGLKVLLETYRAPIISTAIDNFFIDSYAKTHSFPFRLFLKQIVRYTKSPSIYQISINDLINKHFRNPKTNSLYEDILYANTDEEATLIKRLESGDLGTIYDTPLLEIEKAIAKRVYSQGKDAVPTSWTDAYFNRVKIYNTPNLYEKEKELAKEKKREKTSLEKERKRLDALISKLTELSVLYGDTPSKKLKYDYINKNFSNDTEDFKNSVRACKSTDDFKQLIERIRYERRS